MITLPRTVRVWAYGRPVDLRKGYNGLVGIVENDLRSDPMGGELYLFVNGKRTGCKVLLWERTGEMLHGLQAVGVLRRSLCQSIRFAIVRYASCGPSVGPNIRRACGI